MAGNSKGFKIEFDGKTVLDGVKKELSLLCEELVKNAFKTATFDEQTGNLADSFGAAVYEDGVLLEDTMAYRTRQATVSKIYKTKEETKTISGQETMKEYFRSYKPKGKGFAIVLVAGMPYAEVLERGRSKDGKVQLKQKYKVISGAYSVMNDIAKHFQQSGVLGRRGYKQYKFGKGVRATIKYIND